MSELTIAAIKKLKVAELKAELTKRGLAVKGKKDELAKRLMDDIQEDECGEPQEVGRDDSMDTDGSNAVDTDSQESSHEEPDSEPIPEENSRLDSDEVAVVEEADDDTSTKVVTEAEHQTQEVEDETTPSDWVMVEPPSKEEEPVAQEAAHVQDVANEEPADDTAETKIEEPIVTREDSDMPEAPTTEATEAAATEESSKTEESATTETGDVVSSEKTEESATTESGDVVSSEKTEEEKEEEKKPEDLLVEVEEEEGDDYEAVAIAEGVVALDDYSRDLHFIITEDSLCGRNMVKNGFHYLWAGARANKGAKGGKIGYEMKVASALPVELPEKEAPTHAVRIGWSAENSVLQLGESALSYGYESTGKVCASSSFFAYGETFGEGDVIGTYLDLESEPKTLRYTKNGVDLGVAMSLTVNLDEKPLFPHIFLRNMKVQLNFGGSSEPWFETLEGYSLIQNAGSENIADKSAEEPETREQCEVMMMVGLPNAGKSTWVRKYTESHPEKHFNVIGLSELLERCKLEGKSRKRTDDGYQGLMKNLITALTKLYHLCPKKNRNFIYDQTNVYEVAQKMKIEGFSGFKRKAVVLVPTHDNLRRHTSDVKRRGENVCDVPFGDLCDMKCEFHLPVTGELFDEIIYPELDERNASKTVRDYQSDGARAKRTGRDEFYPKKRPRHDDRSYGRRDRNSGGRDNRRDDGWKNSGSGYGGYKGQGGYGGGGGYKGGRSNSGQYQDPYRRSGGGGGGYRQQSYGSGGGGSYGSSGYGSSNYGGYASSYGSSGSYGAGGYGSSASNYNYGSYNQAANRAAAPASSTGHWGQYGSSNYGSNQSQNQQWNTTSGGWGGYNYGNYTSGGNSASGGGSSYGGSGYSY